MRETYDVQNTLNRLASEVYLNVDRPNLKLKRHYHRAVQSLYNAIHEFDMLNDLKDGQKGGDDG